MTKTADPFCRDDVGYGLCLFYADNLGEMVQCTLTGFTAGGIVVASIWSLLPPAMEQAADMGRWSFVSPFSGFWILILSLLGLDRLIPHLHHGSSEAEGSEGSPGGTTMLTLGA